MKTEYFTLITGASEGLGKSFAFECAARNMNLVLVALPGPELQNLSDYLERNFSIKVLIIEQDLSADGSAELIYNKITKMNIEVNILINNAGVGNTRFFEDENRKFIERQIRINVLSTTSLTHMFVPMLKRNGPAYILNVGSLACFFAIPKKQVYGGTKSFIYFFSKSLRAELKQYNINVSVLCPGGINSNPAQIMLNKSGTWISKMSLMNSEDVAPFALNRLLRNKEVIIPGKLNRAFLMLDRVMPVFIKNEIIKHQISQLKIYQPGRTDTLNPSPHFPAPCYKS
ncbi:MAG TPA: SDR family NAD(P)-dependent oxidoreductase [Flavitalea sp.]|nr:SDR family NAD(P)-dependent oxidoreductase [Flavitalea sp.]